VLGGNKGAMYDIAALNAAAALVVAERVDDLKAGLELARNAIDSGKAKAALDTLVRCSQL
jgi:anthranilate phosphoribosyltransferase